MTAWSLPKLLAGLHDDIQQRLERCRKTFGHPGTKGDASEKVWLELLQKYLPQRYQVETAHIVDSQGTFSDQIDVVVFDRQYSPFIFHYEGQKIIPAESVYAVFEAKQTINAKQIEYAYNKIASVRRLHRTSQPVPYVEGTYRAKEPPPIFGGILTCDSDWNPQFGAALESALAGGDTTSCIDIGCVAAHGYFYLDRKTGIYHLEGGGKPATAFLFRFISQLQSSGTVPMIDIQAYAHWLTT
jgi:hypothetical protein